MICDNRRNKGRKLEAQTPKLANVVFNVPLNMVKLRFINQSFRGCSLQLKMFLLNKQEVIEPNASKIKYKSVVLQ